MKKKTLYIILSSIIMIAFLSYTDTIIKLPYIIRSPLKIVLFSLIPISYIVYTKENVIKTSIQNYKNTNIKANIILGILVIITIFISYYFLSSFINMEKIKSDVQNKYHISKTAYIIVALYISFINSFLEELFFRGYLFLNIKKLGYKTLGYILSSFLFAIYHISNINGWFTGFTFILSLIGLFIGGIIFSYLDDKKDTFLNSYIIHICADLAIVIIGYIVLY